MAFHVDWACFSYKLAKFLICSMYNCVVLLRNCTLINLSSYAIAMDTVSLKKTCVTKCGLSVLY